MISVDSAAIRSAEGSSGRDLWESLYRLEYIAVLFIIAMIPIMPQNVYRSPFQLEWLKKLQPVDLFFVPVFAIWLVGTMRNPLRLYRVPLKLPLALYIGTTALSLLSAKDLDLGCLEVVIKIYLAMTYLVIASVIDTEERLIQALRVWLFTAGVVVAIGLVAYALALITGQENFLVYAGRDMPLFGHAFRLKSTLSPTSKLLMTYLIISVPLMIVYFSTLTRNRTERIVVGVSIILMFVAAVLTISRGIVPLMLAIAIVLYQYGPNWKSRQLWAALLVVVSIIGTIGILFISSIRIVSVNLSHTTDPSRQIFDKHYYASDPSRGLESVVLSAEYAYDNYLWLRRAALLMAAENPVLGIGAGNFGVKLAELKQSGLLPVNLSEFGTAQSEPFDRLAETGLLGLVGLGLLSFSLFFQLIRRSSLDNRMECALARSSIATFWGLCLVSLHLDISNFRFIWIFLGLILRAGTLPHDRRAHPEPQ